MKTLRVRCSCGLFHLVRRYEAYDFESAHSYVPARNPMPHVRLSKGDVYSIQPQGQGETFSYWFRTFGRRGTVHVFVGASAFRIREAFAL